MPVATLDLAAPRTILLSERGRTFTVQCRRLLKADWLAYFAAITVTTEQDGGNRVSTRDFTTPLDVLVDRVIIGAEGYAVAGGGKLTDLPEWERRLPLAHRRQVGLALQDCSVSTAEADLVIHAEAEEVLLDATWTANESGGMQRFEGLKHVLATPTQAQYKRYAQESSRSIVVGGSRRGTTIYAGAHKLLVDLYDELVVSVDESYTVNGQPLTSKAQIIAEMDTLHKYVAAEQLFNPTSTVTTGVSA